MNNIAEQILNSEHRISLIKKCWPLLRVIVLSLSAGVSILQAQEFVDLGQEVVELGSGTWVSSQYRGLSEIMLIKSDNPNVATARKMGTANIQIISHGLGKATIEFWENAERKLYRVVVQVIPVGSREPTVGTTGCSAFFNNWNVAGVRNGAAGPRFVLRERSVLCALHTYHWNEGRGKAPGTIGLINKTTGVTYGPYPATASSGQGGADNVDWQVLLSPRVELEPGNYEIIDSDNRSWSWNATSVDMGQPSKASGFAKVWLVQGGGTRGSGSADSKLNSSETAINDSVSENLLINGDAEAGTGSNDGAVVAVPGWQTSGFFTIMRYDGRSDELLSTSPGPSTRGRNFFLGGNQGERSSATQRISVSRFAMAIDSGRAEFRLSGWLGGWEKQNDQTTLTVTFIDDRGARLDTSSIGPVTNIDRENVTGLLERFEYGRVPVGTRWIEVVLRMTRAEGTWNDGFADNLSLTISTR
jgi:hypothetical protein